MAHKTIRDIMTPQTKTVSAGDPVLRAAQMMRDEDMGDVVVMDEGGSMCGIVTDRDIAVRAVAEGKDPSGTRVDDICSKGLTTIRPDDDVDSAARTMRERAVRRLPVTEDGRVVGAVSIGDLAREQDPNSALADISAAPGNP